MYTSINSGFSAYLEDLVDPTTPSGVLKITRAVNAQGLEYVTPAIDASPDAGKVLSITDDAPAQTTFQYPSGYRTFGTMFTNYPAVVGQAGPIEMLRCTINPGTFLAELLIPPSPVTPPAQAVLVWEPVMYMISSGSPQGVGSLQYWIGSNLTVGGQYSTFDRYDIQGTSPVLFTPRVPVLISSLRNGSLTQLRLYVQSTYANTYTVTPTSCDISNSFTYYPYGLGAS